MHRITLCIALVLGFLASGWAEETIGITLEDQQHLKALQAQIEAARDNEMEADIAMKDIRRKYLHKLRPYAIDDHTLLEILARSRCAIIWEDGFTRLRLHCNRSKRLPGPVLEKRK